MIGKIKRRLSLKRNDLVALIVWLAIVLAIVFIIPFGAELILSWRLIDQGTKLTVMTDISGGTLSLGALSLAVLTYSFAQTHSSKTTIAKKPYRTLSVVSFLVISMSLTDSFVATIYLLTKAPFSFEISLGLFFVIIIGLLAMTSIWLLNEFKPPTKLS